MQVEKGSAKFNKVRRCSTCVQVRTESMDNHADMLNSRPSHGNKEMQNGLRVFVCMCVCVYVRVYVWLRVALTARGLFDPINQLHMFWCVWLSSHACTRTVVREQR